MSNYTLPVAARGKWVEYCIVCRKKHGRGTFIWDVTRDLDLAREWADYYTAERGEGWIESRTVEVSEWRSLDAGALKGTNDE